MYRIIAALLALAVLSLPASAATYTLDPGHTTPQFQVAYLLVLSVRGQFNSVIGKLTMDRDRNLGAVEVSIDVGSLSTGYAERDHDLLSEAFFDVARFPAMTFRSTGVTYHGKSAATVEGVLTLRGTSRPVTLDVSRISCEMNVQTNRTVCRFEAGAHIRRSDFGMTTLMPLIADEVGLIINGEAIEDGQPSDRAAH